MPELTIHKYEQGRKFMPRICVVCGKPSTDFVERSVVPLSSNGLFLSGMFLLCITGWLFSFIIFMAAFRSRTSRTPTIELPFCESHLSHFAIRTLSSIFATSILLPVSLLLLFAGLLNYDTPEMTNYVAFGFLAFLVSTTIQVWTYKTMIKPVKVSNDFDATYLGLNETFVAEFLRWRQSNIDEAAKRSPSQP